MNEIEIIDGIECYEKDGIAYLKLEAVARGLGFTRIAASGNEVVMWSRVERYLKDIGYSQKVAKDDSSQEVEKDLCVHTSAHEDFIPENIFYRLAMKAKNEVAEKFQAKIADEVIPAIRKHGAYLTDQKAYDITHDSDSLVQLLLQAANQLQQKSKQLKEEQRKNAILMHTNKTYTATEIAKELGFKSAIALNKDLCDKGIQYKINNTYVLYSQYAQMGLDSIKQQILDNGHEVYNRHFTQEGRNFLLELYGKKIA